MAVDRDELATSEVALIAMATESWRLARLFSRSLEKLDANEANRYASQLRYFQKKLGNILESAGFTLVNIEGSPYDSGAAVNAINLADFEPDDVLLIEQMIEPIIMGPDGLMKEGAVLLRKLHR